MKINHYIIFIACSLSFASCSKDVLNTSPITLKATQGFYKNSTQIDEGVNAAYGLLQTTGQYGINYLCFGELPSDNSLDEVPSNDGGFYGQLDLFQMTSLNGLISDTWRDAYVGIQQCNVILNRIDGVEMDSTTKQNRKGEMLFIRALGYFNLVRIFGDVPLVTQETDNPNAFFGQTRTAKTAIYTQIEKDLNQALDLLTDAGSVQAERVSKGATYTLLGKVLLTQKRYTDAIIALQKAEKSGYSLVDVNTIFDPNQKNNKEIIFAVQFQSGIKGNTEGSNAYQQFSPSGFVNGAKGHNLPTKEVFNMYNTGDKRQAAYLGLTDKGVVYSKKLRQTSSVIQDGGSNVVVLRYADVLLMLAECYQMTGDLVQATNYLNQIRERAGLIPFVSTSPNALADEIALQRRLEFIGEGHRWFDLIRTDKAIEIMNAYFNATPGYKGITITKDQLVQPIPQQQVNTDKAIIQNTGY